MEMAKQATFYNAGRLSGDEADLFMFTCWNADHTSCGCHSVYSRELRGNIEALERMGYAVENLDQRKAA
jgi:hypothetical protein